MKPPLYPLLFEPFLRPMPWGGRRLEAWLGQTLPPDALIGEAWLASDHALHNSNVLEGPLAGIGLHELVVERGLELLGKPAQRFPLLIKLLDARENLSIQVHPDDRLAQHYAPREGGKTEAWLVLESEPNSVIYLGLKPGIDRATLAAELLRDTGPLCLQRHEPKPGQCYFVPAGTIHALGGGLVVLEVQQTSDATFRLYDWGRVDSQGKPRALHLDAGLACVQANPPNAGLAQPRNISAGVAELVNCPYFGIERLSGPATIPCNGPMLLVGLLGQSQLRWSAISLTLAPGRLFLIPASVAGAVWTGEPNAQAARILLP